METPYGKKFCYRYDSGVKQVRQFQVIWDKAEKFVDHNRFKNTQQRLRYQTQNAQIWKDACLLYFQQFSKLPIPDEVERPIYDLEELKVLDTRKFK